MERDRILDEKIRALRSSIVWEEENKRYYTDCVNSTQNRINEYTRQLKALEEYKQTGVRPEEGIKCCWCGQVVRNGKKVDTSLFASLNQPMHRECKYDVDEDYYNSPG